MSRIEEALRRASTQVSAVDAPAPVLRDRLSLALRPLVRIEDYAEEAIGATNDQSSQPNDLPQPVKWTQAHAGGDATKPVSTRVARLVSDPATSRAATNQYRRLGATLHQTQMQQGLKLIMVASSQPSEGKTLTAVNLALTLSASYQRRVLLVDADLRQPAVHELFGISNTMGLADALRGNITAPLHEVSPHITVLPAGQPDAKSLSALVSARMETVLNELVGRFDWVILDTPPVESVPDGQMLAGLVQGVIFIVAAHKTPYNVVDKAITAVGRERIIGTVLNRTEHGNDASAKTYGRYDCVG